MGNTLNTVGNKLKQIPSGISSLVNTVGSNVGKGVKKVGGFINTVGTGARNAYDFASKIPIIGDVIKSSPLGTAVETGLDIFGKSGNLLSDLGEGNWSNAVNDASSMLGKANLSDTSALGTARNLLDQIKPTIPLSDKQKGLIDRFNRRIKPLS
jgi:hypothetical protein